MSVKEEEKVEITTQEWMFAVSVQDINPQEKVFITGSTKQLGLWDYNKMIPLKKETGTDIWQKTVVIPNTCDIFYRYVICTGSENPDDVIVSRWETNIDPRVIKEDMMHPVVDQFGDYGGYKNTATGWLTSQTLIQFKFANNPLKLKTRLAGRLMNIKVTPVKLSFGGAEVNMDESSLSTDTMDVELPAGVRVEVSTLHNDPAICKLHLQEQFGQEYKPDDILLVNVTAPNPKVLAYLVDFYSYSSRAASEDPPCHIGYTYILPNMFKPSEGTVELPVTCNVKHRPLGTVVIEYLVVCPMQNKLCDTKVSYAKHWDPTWKGLEVGHRGLGASFKKKEGDTIRENTIASLKKAAASGADLLEFDVQLSKDMIPVIYHDFYVCISMKRKKEIEFSEMLELPVKDLTLEHLQKLKVYHLAEGRGHEILFFDDDLEEHQPFPTLKNAFHSIDEHVGFNVELKWTMEMKDGTFELDNPFDMNIYVDKVLEVVLKHAGRRRIVFSCFNPDICTMVRYKQNKYPVMFLTIGVTNKYEPYRDPRCLSIPAAVQSAVSADILGIVVHTEDLLRDPTQVKPYKNQDLRFSREHPLSPTSTRATSKVKLATDAGLVIFCWGDDNNDRKTIKKLKQMGLHAVIYDKLDQISTKHVKESIFLMEARESQRDLMASLDKESTPSSSRSEVVGAAPPAAYLDLTVRDTLAAQRSTVTSLESLASSVDLAELDRSLKRNRDVITAVDKDSQVKERVNTFRGMFPPPAGCDYLFKPNPKKTRPDDCV